MKKNRALSFTTGKILPSLILFAGPVLFAMFLQSLYGAIDLLVVGQYASAADVSAVSTGSQILHTVTCIIISFAMGVTVLLGQKIGEGRKEEGGAIIGSSILLFFVIGLVLTVILPLCATPLAHMMNAPVEAFELTRSYIRICGGGSIIIIAYNLISSIFRGMGDAKTPMITVIIASIFNVIGDLLFVAVFHMGARGAATATVMAQGLSVVISLCLIRKQELPFTFTRKHIRFDFRMMKRITGIGAPIALQDLLVSLSFLIIMAIVNDLGVAASAGIGVAEKVCSFIMLVPSSFMQSMAAFVAQNKGAGQYRRASRALWYAIAFSTVIGVIMAYLAFFHGAMLAKIFTPETAVILAAADYLKAYGIDCLLTCFIFCFIGYFNGMGATRFVMVQGTLAAFLVRIPVAMYMSHQEPVSLFYIGLGIPLATLVQIGMAIVFYHWLKRKTGSGWK